MRPSSYSTRHAVHNEYHSSYKFALESRPSGMVGVETVRHSRRNSVMELFISASCEMMDVDPIDNNETTWSGHGVKRKREKSQSASAGSRKKGRLLKSPATRYSCN